MDNKTKFKYKYEDITLEELTQIALEAIKDKEIKQKKMVLYTDKKGYIHYLELAYNRKLTQEEKVQIMNISNGIIKL